jgi:RNA polymerase sigma-70 factor (ECF subfamily)
MDSTKNRREERFISLYRAYVDEIYQYVLLRTCLDAAQAEDMTQDIFLDVFKGMGGFKGLCSERTWVFTIARNRLYDFYRRQYSMKVELVDLDPLAERLQDPGQDMEKLMEAALESKLVCDCLRRIPEHYSITLMLKYVDGKSVREIAALAEKSIKAIESLLMRSKRAFIHEYILLSRKKEGLER